MWDLKFPDEVLNLGAELIPGPPGNSLGSSFSMKILLQKSRMRVSNAGKRIQKNKNNITEQVQLSGQGKNLKKILEISF